MMQLAPDLYKLRLPNFPPYALNAYLMGGVLVDAAARQHARIILRQLRGHNVTAHALTHAHPDHQGSSHAVCTKLGLPYWCGEGDADAAEDPRLIRARLPKHWLNSLFGGVFTGPAHPVARRLREGDEVGGFTVLETPGHSAGHISFWRESDRVLVLGDAVANIRWLTGGPYLREPPPFFTPDPARNRASIRRVAALRPALVCFGHGRPLRDPDRFAAFADALPGD